jgi:uncharacterized protein YraI
MYLLLILVFAIALSACSRQSTPTTTAEAMPTNTLTPQPTAPLPSPEPTSIPTVTPTDTPAPEPTHTPSPEPAVPMVTASEGNVNIRRGPGMFHKKFLLLPEGQSLEIVGRNADSSWWQVSTPEGLGWVAASVTTASNVEGIDIPVVEMPSGPLVTASEGNVNLRRGPGTEYEKVGLLPSGESLQIIGRNTDASWWQVSTPDGPAWIAASVTTAGNVEGASIPVVETPPPPTPESTQPAEEAEPTPTP